MFRRLSVLTCLFSLSLTGVGCNDDLTPSQIVLSEAQTSRTFDYSLENVVADLDNDGDKDIVTVSNASSVAIHLNTGGRSYAASRSFFAGDYTRSAVIADVNADGYKDIIVTNTGEGFPNPGHPDSPLTPGISVLLNDGQAGFTNRKYFSLTSDSGYSNGMMDIQSADLTRDGIPDVVVSLESLSGMIPSAHKIFFLKGNKTQLFETPISMDVPTVGVMRLADLDRNGTTELVLTSHAAQNFLAEIFVYTFSTATGFTPLLHVPMPEGSFAYDIALADVTGDKVSDIVLSTTKIQGYQFFDAKVFLIPLTKSPYTLVAGKPRTLFSRAADDTTSYMGSLEIADMNFDGRLDIVTFGHYQNPQESAFIFSGLPYGQFAAIQRLNAVPRGWGQNDMLLDDLDRDGKTDLLFASVYLNNTLNEVHGISILWNLGRKPAA